MNCEQIHQTQADGVRILRPGESLRVRLIACGCPAVSIEGGSENNTSCTAVHPGVTEASLTQFLFCPEIVWCDRETVNGVNLLRCGCMQAKIGGLILSLEKFVAYGGEMPTGG